MLVQVAQRGWCAAQQPGSEKQGGRWPALLQCWVQSVCINPGRLRSHGGLACRRGDGRRSGPAASRGQLILSCRLVRSTSQLPRGPHTPDSKEGDLGGQTRQTVRGVMRGIMKMPTGETRAAPESNHCPCSLRGSLSASTVDSELKEVADQRAFVALSRGPQPAVWWTQEYRAHGPSS